MKKKHVLIFSTFLLFILAQSTNLHAQKKGKSIKWTTFDNLSSKKMTIVFIYKKEDGWARRMERVTFKDPSIIKYGNKEFNFAKLETTDDASKISSLGITFESSPTIVFLDKDEKVLKTISGYIVTKDFETITKYFGEEVYKEKAWEEFCKEHNRENKRFSALDKQ